MKINADAVIDALATTGEAMNTKAVCAFLGTKNTRQVCGLLTELVLDGSIKRAQNQGYCLPDAAPYDSPARSGGDRIEVPKTEVAARSSRKERGLTPGGQAKRSETIAPTWDAPAALRRKIRDIEDAETAAEEARVINPGDFDSAMNRLAVNIKQTAVLTEPDIKQDMLRKFAEIMEPSIANQCRELDDWITAILSAEKK